MGYKSYGLDGLRYLMTKGIKAKRVQGSVCAALIVILRQNLTLSYGGSYDIETSPTICRENHWTGFYKIGTSVMKELKIVYWNTFIVKLSLMIY